MIEMMMASSASESMLAICTSTGVIVVDTEGYEPVPGSLAISARSATRAVFSHDSRYLAVSYTTAPKLELYDTSTWAKTLPVYIEVGTPAALAFSHDGRYLAMGGPTAPSLSVSDLTENTARSVAVSEQIRSLAFSPNGAYLAVTHFSSPGCVMVNTSTWAKQNVFLGTTASGAFWTADSQRVYLLSLDSGRIRYADAPAFSPAGTITISGLGRQTSDSSAWSPDGRFLALGTQSNGLQIVDSTDWKFITVTDAGEAIKADYNGDQTRLVVALRTGTSPNYVYRLLIWEANPDDATPFPRDLTILLAGRTPIYLAMTN